MRTPLKNVALLVMFLLISSACFSQNRDADPKQVCEQFIYKFVAVGSQLRRSPDMSGEKMQAIFAGQAENKTLNRFMSQFLIPKFLNKNTSEFDFYISSGAAQSQCIALVSGPN